MKISRVVFYGLLVVFALTGITLGLYRADAKEDAKEKAEKPLEMTLKDTEGKEVKLSSFRGKVVVIDVWATWCGFCVREVPELMELQKDAEKDKLDLQIVGISIDRNKDALKDYVKEKEMNYPVLIGEGKEMKKLGDITGVPTKFILNKKGELVDTFVGAMKKDELKEKIDKYLKEE